MSILIKGMEMPTSCWACPCHHRNYDDGYYDYEICRASDTIFNDGYSSATGHKTHIDPFKQRLDNCPLVPVPPHVRLIDANALHEELYAMEYARENEWRDGVREARGVDAARVALLDAPTIIPAEEGE